jgi:hypothetical protein
MKRFIIFLLLISLMAQEGLAFCGFYVARAGASIFNEASQVIIARGRGRTTLTMANDFRGDVNEFAIVVPVPVVLTRDNIKVVDASIFDYLDAHTGPRLVEYHDENPCEVRYEMEMSTGAADDMSPRSASPAETRASRALGVTVLQSFSVGEYDIKVLSAEHSSGLKTWLTQNGYAIPAQAEEVLQPYIRSQMKFFVVKVNLAQFNRSGFQKLRPIQLTYNDPRFMLPIRLGMANSTGFQDLVVYAFSEIGRVEPTNYPLARIPTDKDIPTSVQAKFGAFYKALFDRAWAANGKRTLMLEYHWDLSSSNFMHCDPCNNQPPSIAQLQQAGIHWVEANNGRNGSVSSDYIGNVFITRIHARYNRALYPEDLQFQETPGTGNFQGRYVMRHPATGDLDCDAGRAYTTQLRQRQAQELQTLALLTGWTVQGGKLPNGTSVRDSLDRSDDGTKGLLGIGGGNDGNSNDGPSSLFTLPEVSVADPQVGMPWLTNTVRIGAAATLLGVMCLLVLRNRRRLQRT